MSVSQIICIYLPFWKTQTHSEANLAVYLKYAATLYVKSHLGWNAFVHTCIFPQFSHKDSVRRVSAYQTWVFLYPAFQFSIDLGRVTLKRPEKHRSTKTSSLPLFHQKDSLGPGWFHSQARYWCRPGFITWWLEPERNRGGTKYQIAFGSKLSGLVPACHPSYHLSLSLSLSGSLFIQEQRLLWFLSLRRSLQNHWSSQFLF